MEELRKAGLLETEEAGRVVGEKLEMWAGPGLAGHCWPQSPLETHKHSHSPWVTQTLRTRLPHNAAPDPLVLLLGECWELLV